MYIGLPSQVLPFSSNPMEPSSSAWSHCKSRSRQPLVGIKVATEDLRPEILERSTRPLYLVHDKQSPHLSRLGMNIGRDLEICDLPVIRKDPIPGLRPWSS